MRAFQITIGARGNARLSFYCMAPDSFTAQMQHLDLAEVGERVSVVAVGEESLAEDAARAYDAAAIANFGEFARLNFNGAS